MSQTGGPALPLASFGPWAVSDDEVAAPRSECEAQDFLRMETGGWGWPRH